MMIRKFKVNGQIWSGFYLPDGNGDVQFLTNNGHEIFYEWEVELVE